MEDFGSKRKGAKTSFFALLEKSVRPFSKKILKIFFLGIAFFITNYFCGNKSVFAVLNEPLYV